MTHQSALVLLAAALSNLVVCATWRRHRRPTAGPLDRLLRNGVAVAGLLGIGTLAIWSAIFVVYGFPVSGDVAQFYRPQGRAAFAGQVPTMDFPSSYMPLFPYVMGVVDWISPNDLSIPLFLAVAFAASHVLWRQVLVLGGVDRAEASLLALAAAFNGAAWVLGIGYQQDEVLLTLLLVAAIGLVVSRRDAAAGFVAGLGCLATKVLFAAAAIGLGAAVSVRRRLVLGFALGLVPGLALFASAGFSLQTMLASEARSLQPPSLTVLAAAVPALSPPLRSHLWIPQAAIALALLGIVLGRRPLKSCRHVEGVAALVASGWLVALLLSPKSLTSYRLVILPLIPLLIGTQPRMIAWFGCYSTALAVQYMFYEDWINQPYAEFATASVAAAEHWRLAAVIGLDLCIVISEMAWLRLAIRRTEWRWAASGPLTSCAPALVGGPGADSCLVPPRR
jgi:hypothetical protein